MCSIFGITMTETFFSRSNDKPKRMTGKIKSSTQAIKRCRITSIALHIFCFVDVLFHLDNFHHTAISSDYVNIFLIIKKNNVCIILKKQPSNLCCRHTKNLTRSSNYSKLDFLKPKFNDRFRNEKKYCV